MIGIRGRKGAAALEDILEGLNAAQREAVTATEGYVRVIAGAGSGKTRALSRRFAWLVEGLGVMPGHILCVTFSNKSANEMRQRIHALTGDNDTGYVNTFHGFCVSVLQEDSHAVQYPKSFIVLDNSDIDDILRIVYAERGLTLRDMTFAEARDMFEIRKLFKEPLYCRDLIALPLELLRKKYEEAAEPSDILFYGYLYQQKKCFGLDYNDLIVFTLHIFEREPEIRRKWQQRLEYIMIDEFQDIDGLQYRLMEALCGFHKNLFVVGDPDQTIYTWRGASVRYLLDFDARHPGTRTIMMMENYRSTPQILAAANSLIDKNETRVKKDLLPVRAPGAPVRCFHGETAEDEARWIAAEIKKLREADAPYKSCAVLYRAHYLTRSLEAAFLKEKIPYTIYAGVQFYDRAEIKDALAYLRLVAYRDDLAFRRVVNAPRRNMGARRMAFLEEQAASRGCSLWEALTATLDEEIFKGTRAAAFVSLIERFAAAGPALPVSEALSGLLDESGYEAMLRTEGAQQRLDNLAELKQSVHEYETTCGEESGVADYLRRAALFTDGDRAESADTVRFMTVHAAKGLEFPHVFLCGMNEGVFPTRRTRTLHAMEEERRLAFVAVTRARDALCLTEADGRTLDGSPRYPSRFILDIDQGLLQYVTPPRPGLIEEARYRIAESEKQLRRDSRIEALPLGTAVTHPVFGPGVIVEADAGELCYTVRFDRLATPRRLSFKAPLTKV